MYNVFKNIGIEYYMRIYCYIYLLTLLCLSVLYLIYVYQLLVRFSISLEDYYFIMFTFVFLRTQILQVGSVVVLLFLFHNPN